jgi:uroporphyrinogen decarboxylase
MSEDNLTPQESLAIDPNPDFTRLETVLRREGQPDRVPTYEVFSNIEPHVLRYLGLIDEPRFEAAKGLNTWNMDPHEHSLYMLNLGYDYLLVRPKGFVFTQPDRVVGMTNEGERGYLQGETRLIENRKDFESYPWPDPEEAEYEVLDDTRVPPGMKIVVGYTGMLENVMWLLGYEGLSYLLYEETELVKDMFDTISSRIVAYLSRCASFDSVGAIQMADDMGFKTQTFLSPEMYRRYLFPWHRRLVEEVHAHGKPLILHACGCLEAVMEDIIDCGWDAKHSYEDAILPVWEAKERWGDRIAVLGGFDMHRLCTMHVDEVRDYARFLINRCAPGGGWAMGSGNSIATYVPMPNLLAMQEETMAAGRYHNA